MPLLHSHFEELLLVLLQSFDLTLGQRHDGLEVRVMVRVVSVVCGGLVLVLCPLREEKNTQHVLTIHTQTHMLLICWQHTITTGF